MGTRIKIGPNTIEALEKAGVAFLEPRQDRAFLVVPEVPAHEDVTHQVERELHQIEGYKEGKVALYEEHDGAFTATFSADESGEKALEFRFDREGNIRAVEYDGLLENPVEVTDSSLVSLAERARKMFRGATGKVIPSELPQQILNTAYVSGEFVQGMRADGSLVLAADWNGRCPKNFHDVRGMAGKLYASWMSRAAEITVTENGKVTIAKVVVKPEVDERGLRRVARNTIKDGVVFEGPHHQVPPTWRSAVRAAVDAIKLGMPEDPIEWGTEDVEEMA